MNHIARALPFLALVGALASAQAGPLASFDDLALPPALNGSVGLQYTNTSNSLLYQGVSWDPGLSVVGDAYRVDAVTPGPLFGLPHSGHYFVTNQDGANGLKLTTTLVLQGAWFGRNEYYGFGAGADQISIVALAGGTELAQVVFDLPQTQAGQPEPLSFVDTQAFAGLLGITGYRIDRRELGTQSGHWVADDFQFAAATAVPEPGSASLWLIGVLGLRGAALASRRRRA